MAQDTAQTPTGPTKVKSQRAVREVGYTNPNAGEANWWHVDADGEQTPELQWPDNIPIYDAMRRQDPQVSSVLRAVSHPVRRTKWRLDPGAASDEVVQHCSQDLGLPIVGEEDPKLPRTRDRFLWSEHLRLALLMLPFGHSVFEQSYRIDDAGAARLRKLGERMPRSIAKWNVARDGGLISIEQHPENSASPGKGPVLPINRLVVYSLEREGAAWYGQSILRPAYKMWLVKDRMLRVGAQAVERNGMGIPAYTGHEGATQDSIDDGQALAESVRAGDNAGLGLPYGARMELLGVQGQIRDPLPFIKYLDDQITTTVLAHFLNLGGATGSWALGTTFADFFTQSLQAVAQQIADVATAHIVEDLVDLNWGPDEPAPRIVFDEIGSQTIAVAQAIKMLVDAGVLTADEGLEKFLRTGLGLPSPSAQSQEAPA